jgi:hypothetical protein
MLPGYHLLLRAHAARQIMDKEIEVPKPELAVDFAEIKNPIIPPIPLKPQMPVRVKIYDIKTSDDIIHAGKGKLFSEADFPKDGWIGADLTGV